MSLSFRELDVPARMVDALAAAGIEQPFPVQAVTLPDALAGRDLCGRAPTGSGKTLGFGIPLMARVSQATPNHPTGLVLVPTRELAEQVQRAFVPLGRAAWRFVQAVYGGSPMAPQIHSLRKGASVVVATPGRLLDLIEQGHCNLSKVEVLVIDEADRMADLGFMPDVRKILEMTPDTRQTMLWSATLDGDVNELIADFLQDPVRHDLVGEIDHGTVEHRFVVTAAMERVDAAAELMREGRPTIVFVKTRFGVDDVTAALMNAGVRAGSLHGARTQAARQRTLEDFKRGKVQALVATDVAARGIHVDDVDLVVHYDLPDNEKDYLHRSGRTGRAGRDGTVVAFVPPSRVRVARRLIDSLDVEVTWDPGASLADRADRPARPSRPSYEERVAQADRRPAAREDRPRREWQRDDRPRTDGPRADRPRSDRPRTDRPSYGDTRSSGAARPARSDRPTYGDRPAYGDRSRPAYGERPAYGDRPRPFDRDARGDDRRDSRPGRPSAAGRPSANDRSRGERTFGAGGGRDGARPASDRPYGARPSGARPDGARPNGARPNGARPNGARPTEARSFEARPATNRPAGRRPGPAGSFRRPADR